MGCVVVYNVRMDLYLLIDGNRIPKFNFSNRHFNKLITTGETVLATRQEYNLGSSLSSNIYMLNVLKINYKPLYRLLYLQHMPSHCRRGYILKPGFH